MVCNYLRISIKFTFSLRACEIVFTSLFSRAFQLKLRSFNCLIFMAEDIYTAAGWECLYQNGYLHGSPSRFSAKSAIYTAAGCQHIIAIYTAAVPEQIQTIYTAAMCPNKTAISTAALQEPNRLYTLLPGAYIKNCYLHGSHSRANSAIYIAAGCIYMKLLFIRQRIHEAECLFYLCSKMKGPDQLCDSAQLIRAFVFAYVKRRSGFGDSHS